MAVMETLWVLFKSNAAQIKKDYEKATKASKDMETELKGAAKAGAAVGKAFTDAAKSFASLAAGALSVYAVFDGLRGATDYAVQLGNLANLLGVNVAELDEWSNAAVAAGGSAEAFQSSLRALSSNTGLTPSDALKALPKFADALQQMGRVRAFQYGKSLGLDESTIRLLMHGSAAVEELVKRQKELGVVTAKQMKVTREFNRSWIDMRHAMRSMFGEVATEGLPVLKELLDAMTKTFVFLRKHKDVVIGAFIGIGAAAGVMLTPFIVMYGEVIAIIAAIGLLIAAFALLYEDIKFYMEGNNSLIGKFIDQWPILSKAVKAAMGAFGDALNPIEHILSLIRDTIKQINDLTNGGLSRAVSQTIDYGKGLLGFASSTPLSAQTSNSILNQGGSRVNQNFHFAGITVETRATEPKEIGRTVGNLIVEQVAQAAAVIDTPEK